MTELVGDIVLNCTGGTPIPAGQRVPTANVTVFLNAQITSGTLQANFIEATLLIDDPPPANQIVAPFDTSTGLSYPQTLTGNGGNINFAAGAAPNIAFGSLANVNGVTFNGVPIAPNPTGSRVFRIANVRVNATSLPVGSVINAQVSLAPTPPGTGLTPFTFSSLPVGTCQYGLGTTLIPTAASHQFPLNLTLLNPTPSLPSNPVSSVLKFNELFPTAFKTRVNTTQNVPGQVYNSEGGFDLPATADPVPFPDYGTRLRAIFNNIPTGVSIFVSTTDEGSNGKPNSTPQAQLVSGGSAAGSTGLSKLSVTNGSAQAVWEVTGPAPPTSLPFGIFPAFQSGGTIDTAPAAPTNISVIPSYSSTPGGTQFVQPPSSAPAGTIFTINSATGLPPQFSVTVDPRPCILGAPYADPTNACSPGNNPQVLISSDSGLLTPSFSPSTTGGVQIAGTFSSGSTPVNGTLNVTAPGVAPGTYPQTLNFSAPGAPTLHQTFNVTVPAANAPFIQPGGITDAFSFQSGTVAPGQIYAMFGKFGPSSGLVAGTVDSAGKVGTNVANTQVLFDSVASPLLYVGNGQLAGVAPFEINGKSSTKVQVVSNGVTSSTIMVPVASSSISIASANGSGGGGGVVINADGTLNSALNPASVGDEIVIYVSYAGLFANGVTGTDGRTTTGSPYPAPAGPLSVTFGGVPATNIPYFGNVPTLLESVMQINAVIPAGAKPGTAIPLVVSAGGASSSGMTTIAIK
ncbi:MAG TPA: hypothetical protein VK789_04980 [Bryobacteraceae bacterium]|nr:hypothetical protein [Bryobacteraceae bacterium]